MAEKVSLCLVETVDQVGKLAEITEALAQGEVNIRAVCAWTEGDKGKMLILCDNCTKACEIFCTQADKCITQEGLAVVVPNEVGALAGVTAKIAKEGINILFACATTCGESSLVLMNTDNNERAAEVC